MTSNVKKSLFVIGVGLGVLIIYSFLNFLDAWRWSRSLNQSIYDNRVRNVKELAIATERFYAKNGYIPTEISSLGADIERPEMYRILRISGKYFIFDRPSSARRSCLGVNIFTLDTVNLTSDELVMDKDTGVMR